MPFPSGGQISRVHAGAFLARLTHSATAPREDNIYDVHKGREGHSKSRQGGCVNSNTRGGAGNPGSCIHVDVTSEGALMTNDRNRIRGKKGTESRRRAPSCYDGCWFLRQNALSELKMSDRLNETAD